MGSVLIRGGTVATADEVVLADVRIEGEIITEIGRDLRGSAGEIIDAAGMIVMPGAVDAHVHLDMPFCGTVCTDDFETGTIAAAVGGTTTIMDFPLQEKGGSLAEAIDIWSRKAEGRSVADYAFHPAITDAREEVLAEIPGLVRERGITSFKLYMAYKGALMVDDGALFRALGVMRDAGALCAVHAENGDVIDVLVKRLLAEGKRAPKFHAASRPPELEAEATHRAIAIAALAGAPLYIVHVTCAGAVSAIAAARARGLPVMGETCVQYLFLSADACEAPGFEGAKFVISPPLREAWHQDSLWDALRRGDLQAVSSDHCPFYFKGQKEMGRDDFSKIPNGAPGIENRADLLFQGGVVEGRLGLRRYVDVVSTGPAKCFGLHPRKGAIAAGSDADIVVRDPGRGYTISAATQLQRVDYNPYEGRWVAGLPVIVMRRGEIIARERRFVGRVGGGRFLVRAPAR